LPSKARPGRALLPNNATFLLSILGYLVGDANEPIVLGCAHSKKSTRPAQVATKKIDALFAFHTHPTAFGPTTQPIEVPPPPAPFPESTTC
jgi:hypothetical protein